MLVTRCSWLTRRQRVFVADVTRAAAVTPAGRLADTASLGEAKQAINELTGKSEIMYATRMAEQRRQVQAHLPSVDDLASVDGIAAEARTRGAAFISIRRLAEILGATTPETYAALTVLLAGERPNNYRC